MTLPKLLKPEQVAELLQTTPNTLAVWRCTRRINLPYVKIGKKVLYDEEQVLAFLVANTVNPTTSA